VPTGCSASQAKHRARCFLDLYAFANANNRDGRYDAFIQSVASRFARAPRTPATPPMGETRLLGRKWRFSGENAFP
jgi:hypothetical protein